LAEEIIFKNGDCITAVIVEENDQNITVRSDFLGTITIDRSFVKSPSYNSSDIIVEEEEKKVEWGRKISIGYSKFGGNTIKSQANGELSVNRKTDDNELTFRATAFYSSADKKMDAQKYYGLVRYAFSLGDKKQWYNFYKLEADHDRFSNIDYRLIPALGVGRWLVDQGDWKRKAEMAGGFEYAEYRDGRDSSTNFMAVPRGYMKKLLMKNLWFEQDLTFYLTVDDLEQYRLRSESSLIHRLSEKLSWKLSVVNDYNSDPGGDSKKNDYRLIYEIDYSF
jgi:putative salt-induced outer membrane protein YdiY